MNTYLLLAYVFIWLCTAIVVIQKPTGIDFIASLIVAALWPLLFGARIVAMLLAIKK